MATDPPPMNDPFASLEGPRTFLRPNPGGWAARPAAEPTGDVGALEAPPVDHGFNPLLAVANRLLMLVPQLRQTRHVADPAALRASLAQGIRDFVTAAHERGIAPERVMAARYVLCTMLDEAAADTPWGGAGVWGRHSLLAEFHNEAFGGEKVFQLMAQAGREGRRQPRPARADLRRDGDGLRRPLPRHRQRPHAAGGGALAAGTDHPPAARRLCAGTGRTLAGSSGQATRQRCRGCRWR